jgi:thymidylate synthase (FAD)
MKVTLLHNTPLRINAIGARTCWDSGDKSDTEEAVSMARQDAIMDGNDCFFCSDNIIGEKDATLIDRVGNKFKHQSILEHVSYNFYIEGISRALLQELARHRIASLSVKSTRYTLKELKENCYFTNTNQAEGTTYRWDEIGKYIVLTGMPLVDEASAKALINLKEVLESGISNDKAKYCLPEAYKTELTWTINMRSLQNFLLLRSDKGALWEIRDLANMIYSKLPAEHKYLFTDSLKVYDEV